jgi:hypothetical protein
MIDETSIKDKEFEGDLGRLIGQVRFIGLTLAIETVDDLCAEDFNGAGCFLLDIAEDLRTIKKALYPEEEEGPEVVKAIQLTTQVLREKPEAGGDLRRFMENLLQEDSEG